MQIAFYAPMKPPDHPVPSGDRRMGRLLIQALRRAGHDVAIASRLRSWNGDGDPAAQERIRRRATGLAERFVDSASNRRPDVWFTYHLYHKAPDWLGPMVSMALGIPYVAAEVSFAPKRDGGPWSIGHAAVRQAIGRLDGVIHLNPDDEPCVRPLLKSTCRRLSLAPFLDPDPFDRARRNRAALRSAFASSLGVDPDLPWLVSTAMMRPGDKLSSFRILGEALAQMEAEPWILLVAGDGPARQEVETVLPSGHRVRFLGTQSPAGIADLHAASDLFVWPAINEAFGLAILEAQAAGLPVIAGRSAGVASLVRDGRTGRLTPPGDPVAFADAVKDLIGDQGTRNRMGQAAQAKVRNQHSLDHAAASVDDLLARVTGRLAA